MHDVDEGGWRRAVLIDGDANGHRKARQAQVRVSGNKAKLTNQLARHEIDCNIAAMSGALAATTGARRSGGVSCCRDKIMRWQAACCKLYSYSPPNMHHFKQ
jgi:hypothetical protein